jgi:rhodanese-related sulfurtransferase
MTKRSRELFARAESEDLEAEKDRERKIGVYCKGGQSS